MKRGGSVYGWGSHTFGGIPFQSSGGVRLIPEPQRVIHLSAGWRHCFAVTEQGEVWSWGFKRDLKSMLALAKLRRFSDRMMDFLRFAYSHQLQTPTLLEEFGEKKTGRELLAATTASGGDHAAILTRNGEVWTFGNNFNSQRGWKQEGMIDSLHKVGQIKELPPIVQVACGFQHTVALSKDGEVWSWGKGSTGALGIAPEQLGYSKEIPARGINPFCLHHSTHPSHHFDFPQKPTTAATTTATTATTTTATTTTSTTTTVNSNSNSNSNSQSLSQSQSLPKMVAISAGFNHTAMVDVYGRVWTCGMNHHGQLGVGDFNRRWAPTLVGGVGGKPGQPSGSDVMSVACGQSHTLALTRNGEVYGWGSDQHGQLRRPPNQSTQNPITPQKMPCFLRPGPVPVPEFHGSNSSKIHSISAGFYDSGFVNGAGGCVILGSNTRVDRLREEAEAADPAASIHLIQPSLLGHTTQVVFGYSHALALVK